MSTRWIVEKGWKVNMPDDIEAASLDDLRKSLQDLADTYRPTDHSPSLGELEYRYELDDEDEEVIVVHAYFRDKHQNLQRFARVAHEDVA
jgi:hypothetical protein